MKMQIILLALVCAPAVALESAAARSSEKSAQGSNSAISAASGNAANPIRKVVTMLQMMMNKIEAEAKKEQALYDKFVCYCETGEATLDKTISDAMTKIPILESDIKEAVSNKATLEAELKQAQVDRDAAKVAEDKATAIREKEAAAFAKYKGDADSNIEALTKAVAAISKGMGGFLQTSAASVLRSLTINKVDMQDYDRQELVAFLSGSQTSGYAPASGEILGILKQLKDEMDKDLAEATEAENGAIKTYEELMAAKKKEEEALSAAIEDHLKRIGELGVEIVTMKNDLEDTQEALSEDQKFMADLGATCESKKKEWDLRCKTRQEELLALSETIKILNDDDALELFKKALPSSSLIQLEVSSSALRKKALRILKSARQTTKKNAVQHLELDFISLALQGKKAGFEKVIKLIDEMVVTLAKEQQDDDHKKEYCVAEFDLADDKKKELERAIDDSEKAITETEEALTTIVEEIEVLEETIKGLDKSVAEATEQRKEENEEYAATLASNTAAKEIILFAKNRMQKFYNPKLYKPPPKRELTEEERITLNMGGTLAPTNPPGGIAGTGIAMAEVRVHSASSRDAPPPPPETTFGGKKTEESGGVLAMMDLLVKEVEKEIQEAEFEEKDAQEDYEKYMGDCSAQRAEASKDVTDKEAAKAQMEKFLQESKDKKVADGTELKNTMEFIASLHNECDFLLQYYTERKEARAGETDALKKAKAVLSGADYSFIQTK